VSAARSERDGLARKKRVVTMDMGPNASSERCMPPGGPGSGHARWLPWPPMPYYICPKCKERSVDVDAREGFSTQAPACRHCGFGFLFELLDDYYPAPDTGLLVTDQERRVLAIGRGVFELTGFPEADLMGRDVVEALRFSDAKPVELAREWGVRRLGEHVSIQTRSGHEKPVVADVFPAYDDDGGLLVALTPRR
jgi:hypothetical protein